MRTAQALAVNEKTPLSMIHIAKVLEVAETFEKDLKGGTGYEGMPLYATSSVHFLGPFLPDRNQHLKVLTMWAHRCDAKLYVISTPLQHRFFACKVGKITKYFAFSRYGYKFDLSHIPAGRQDHKKTRVLIIGESFVQSSGSNLDG